MMGQEPRADSLLFHLRGPTRLSVIHRVTVSVTASRVWLPGRPFADAIVFAAHYRSICRPAGVRRHVIARGLDSATLEPS
jgi:hypothetical protein